MYACQNASKNTFFISCFDLYVTQKNICSFNYFSKYNNGITNYTTEYFPFFKEYEPTCNQRNAILMMLKVSEGKI